MNKETITMEYFACDWIVRAGAPYGHFATTAAELGCELVQINPERTYDNGCMYIHLVINVPDDSVLTAYMERIGNAWGLTTWYMVGADHYARGKPFYGETALQLNPLLGLLWTQEFNAMGHQNEQNCPDKV
jgi:hypothetical protein